MERFVIRNYGPSRNLPDGHGSYIFMERDGVRGTSNEEMAKLFKTYPEVAVSERGSNFVGNPPPQGPPPPVDSDDVIKKSTYEDLDKRSLQDMAKLRKIPVAGLSRIELIEALYLKDDSEKAVETEAEVKVDIDYQVLGYKDLQEIAKERGIRSVGVSQKLLIELLQEDDGEK